MDPETPGAASEDDQTAPRSEANAQAAQDQRPPMPQRPIGPYKLLGELGHGGMGTVYLAARADDEYQKRVAIKVIRTGMGGAEVVRRFRRERQILAGLDHPNIGRLLDGGTTEDGLPYLVMELVEGQPLDEYCDGRKLRIVERLEIFQQVCSAVAYAHRNLTVHRDLKPSNILVTAEGVPRLLDFGIAKLLTPELSGDEAPTATGLAMTPDYASPEQARGELVTTASDVYSLGVILYELLTGRRPYRLKTRQPLEILKAVCEEEPERPSAAVGPRNGAAEEIRTTALPPEDASRARETTPARLRRRLRGDLDNIVMMALRKEAQRRYVSVDALSEDIRRYLDGAPVMARKGTAAYRAGKYIRRHALGVTAAATVVLLVVGFAVSMTVQSARLARERDRAAKAQDKAEKVASFLVDLFNVSDPINVSDPNEARGDTITAREILDKGAERIRNELTGQPETRATLMDTIGRVYTSLGLFDKALPLLDEALGIRRRTLGGENVEVADAVSALGQVLWRKGDYAGAEAAFREALAMRRRLLGSENADVAASLNDLGIVLHHRGEAAEAEALFREALAMRRRALGNDHRDVATSLNDLAVVLEERGDFEGAEALYHEALATDRRLLGNGHRNVAMDLENLANLLDEKGDAAAAEASAREALAIYTKVLGGENPEVAGCFDALGAILEHKGDLAAAERLYREALALRRKRLPVNHPDTARSLASIGRTLTERGDAKQAETLLREAVKILRGALPRGHSTTAEAEGSLGRCLTALHRYAEAEPLLLGSYPVLRSRSGDHSRQTLQALEGLVGLYDAWGKPEKAREYRARTPGPSRTAASPAVHR